MTAKTLIRRVNALKATAISGKAILQRLEEHRTAATAREGLPPSIWGFFEIYGNNSPKRFGEYRRKLGSGTKVTPSGRGLPYAQVLKLGKEMAAITIEGDELKTLLRSGNNAAIFIAGLNPATKEAMQLTAAA